MQLSQHEYERIARRLDGEAVDLTAAERAAAEEILRDERALRPALAVCAPSEAMAKARRRLTAELARPAHGIRWIRYLAASVSSAAIALIAVGLMRQIAPPFGPRPPVPLSVYVDALDMSLASTVAYDLLNAELKDLTRPDRDTTPVAPPAPGLSIDDVERKIEEFVVEDPLWDLLEG